MAHSNWAEWIYLGVVTALLIYVGAEAWNVERLIEHTPEDAELIKVTAQQWLWSFEHEVETFPDVQKRVLDMVDHVLKKHNNENVILVTHMDPINSMLAKVMNLLPETLFELIIANASLTIIKEQDKKFSLSAINAMNIDRYYQTW